MSQSAKCLAIGLLLLAVAWPSAAAARARRTTALHEAIRFHQLDAVRLLLGNAADISLRDGGGRTVLQSAWPQQARGRDELMAMLFEAGAG